MLSMIERELNSLVHCHGSSICPKRSKFHLRDHGPQSSNSVNVFHLFVVCHEAVDLFAQELCCAKELYRPLRFFFRHREITKAFQLIGNRGAISHILPTLQSLKINLLCLTYFSGMTGNVTQFAG